MFNASTFEATYADGYDPNSISHEEYQQSWIKAEEGFNAFKKTQEVVDEDGFTFIPTKASKKQVKGQTAATQYNALKTGAIMAGRDIKTSKYVYCYAMSGSTHKKDVEEMRKHWQINEDKATFCAEENLIASNLNIRFYVCIAFRIDDSGVVVIPPCGHHKPFQKCKKTLRDLAIDYEYKSKQL